MSSQTPRPKPIDRKRLTRKNLVGRWIQVRWEDTPTLDIALVVGWSYGFPVVWYPITEEVEELDSVQQIARIGKVIVAQF